MPVCVHCAAPADHLYTTYRTKSNIRLGVCTRCNGFLDPLIEHPALIVLLDLVLLKPRAFLHLLYNRGTPPLDAEKRRSAGEQAPRDVVSRDQQLHSDLARLTAATVIGETMVRFLPAIRGDEHIAISTALRTCLGVVVELSFQLAASTSLAVVLLWAKGWIGRSSSKPNTKSSTGQTESVPDGRRQDFSIILIPLIILYTSVVPLIFQLVLSIWYDPPDPTTTVDLTTLPTAAAILGPVYSYLPDGIPATLDNIIQAGAHIWTTTDLMWAGTRLLGGMSAGFGLRTALPTKPWETTAIVLLGWGAAHFANEPAASVEALRAFVVDGLGLGRDSLG